jgi:hypothetical protein
VVAGSSGAGENKASPVFDLVDVSVPAGAASSVFAGVASSVFPSVVSSDFAGGASSLFAGAGVACSVFAGGASSLFAGAGVNCSVFAGVAKGAARFALARAVSFISDDLASFFFEGVAPSVFALGPGVRALKQFSRSASCGMARQCATSSSVAAEAIVGLAIASMNPAMLKALLVSAAIRSLGARRRWESLRAVFNTDPLVAFANGTTLGLFPTHVVEGAPLAILFCALQDSAFGRRDLPLGRSSVSEQEFCFDPVAAKQHKSPSKKVS